MADRASRQYLVCLYPASKQTGVRLHGLVSLLVVSIQCLTGNPNKADSSPGRAIICGTQFPWARNSHA